NPHFCADLERVMALGPAERVVERIPRSLIATRSVKTAKDEVLRKLDRLGNEWNSILPRQSCECFGPISVEPLKSRLRNQHRLPLAEPKFVHDGRRHCEDQEQTKETRARLNATAVAT